jgi:hypothetical protein
MTEIKSQIQTVARAQPGALRNMDFFRGRSCKPVLFVDDTSATIRIRLSSVSIVSDYALDDRAIGVRSLAEAKEFFLYSLCLHRLWGSASLLSTGYRRSYRWG